MNSWRNWAMRSLMFGVGLVALLSVSLRSGRAAEKPGAAPPVVAPPTTTALTTVKVGDGPNGIAVNSNTNRVYVTNYGDGTVSVLDGKKHAIIARVKIGEHLHGMAVNPITNRIYVGNCSNNAVCVLDGNTNAVIATVKMETNPYSIAVNPILNRIYVTSDEDNTLRVIDGNTNNVIHTANFKDTPTGVAINPVTNRVYVVNGNRVSVLAEKTYTETATVLIGENPKEKAKDLTVDSTTNQIFVTNLTTPDGTLRVIDGNTNTVIASVKVGRSPQGVAVNPTTGQLFVTNYKDNTVSVIDAITRTLVSTVPMTVDSIYFAVAVNPNTQQVYVVNTHAEISIFDGNAFLTDSQRAYANKPHGTDSAVPPLSFEEHFATETLDLTRWGVMQNVTGPGGSIEIVGTNQTDRRLRLRIDKTAQSRSRLQGIYSKNAVIDFEHPHPTEINVDLDWSKVDDSRDELAAGIVISPNICQKDFDAESADYLQVMYHGDGDNPTQAHLEVRVEVSNDRAAPGHRGVGKTLFDEGYFAAHAADRPFVGRKLGLQHLRIVVSEDDFAVWENDKLLFEQTFTKLAGLASPLPWVSGHLYLVQSGVENKSARDVFFSNLTVRQLPSVAVDTPQAVIPTVAPAPTAPGILTAVPVGKGPAGVAVNPTTSRVYVATTTGTVVVLDSRTNAVVQTVELGKQPNMLAVNPTTNRIYVTDFAANQFTILDGATHTVLATIPTEEPLQGIAVNSLSNRVYATVKKGDKLLVFDGNTNAQLASITLGTAAREIAVDAVANHLYVTDARCIDVIDGTTHAFIATIPFAGMPKYLEINPVLKRLYVATVDALSVIDLTTKKTVATVPLGTNLKGVVVNPATCQVFVTDYTGNTVRVLDGTTNTVSTTLTLPEKTAPYILALDPATNRVYVTTRLTGTVTVLDGAVFLTDAERAFAKTHPVTPPAKPSTPSTSPQAAPNGVLATVPVGQAPLGVAVNSATHCVYVANWADNTVSIIDANTNQIVKTVTVGANPTRVAVSPATHRAYVTCSGATDMSVLDGTTHAVVTTIPVEQNAQSVAVNPVTNLIYVVSEDEQKYLRVFDEKQNAKVDIRDNGGGFAEDVAVNPTLNRIYVAVSNTVSVVDAKPNIDGENHTIIAAIRLPDSCYAIAVNPNINRIYAPVKDQLYVLDGAKNAILTTVKLAKGLDSLAVNASTGQIYGCCQPDKSLYIIDGVTNTLTKVLSLGEKGVPTGVAVDPVTNRVYVTLREHDSLCVLDGNTWLTDAERDYMQKISIPPPPKPDNPGPLQWMNTQSEPFAGSTIETVKRNGAEPWLHLRLDTMKSPNGMVKCHGVRTRDAVIDLAHPTEITVALDWNHPTSSAEMQAGLYLCPEPKSLAPALNTQHFIKVMYYGGLNVGGRARLEVSICDGGQENIIYDEGYRTYTRDAQGEIVDTDFGGPDFHYRTIGIQRLRLVIDNKGLAVWENDTQVCQCQFATLPNAKKVVFWPNCYLFLQQECHVKHPAREVFFSPVNIRQRPEPSQQ